MPTPLLSPDSVSRPSSDMAHSSTSSSLPRPSSTNTSTSPKKLKLRQPELLLPSRVIQLAIVEAVADMNFDHHGKIIWARLQAQVVYWLWISFGRESKFLLGEVTTLVHSCNVAYKVVADAFQAYHEAKLLATSSSTTGTGRGSAIDVASPAFWIQAGERANSECIAHLPPAQVAKWKLTTKESW